MGPVASAKLKGSTSEERCVTENAQDQSLRVVEENNREMKNELNTVSQLVCMPRPIGATAFEFDSGGEEMKKRLSIFVLGAAMLVMVVACAPGTVAQINTPAPSAQTGAPAPSGQINVPGVSIQTYAPGPNPMVNKADDHGRVAGILLGIWHGVISPVTLVLSFVNTDVQMYEVFNDGSQYNLGFLVGVAIVFVLLGLFAGSRR